MAIENLSSIDSNCFNGFAELSTCAMREVIPDTLLFSVFALIVIAYLLHRAGVSFTTSLPLIVLFMFSMIVMAYAGTIFSILILAILFLVGIVFALVVIRHFYR